VRFGVTLLVISSVIYIVHYLIFRDLNHIEVYFLSDLAFVPIQVLLVTFLVDRVLAERERRDRIEKVNMVIGVFYSEVGVRLIKALSACDPEINDIRRELIVKDSWGDKEFEALAIRLRGYGYRLDRSLLSLPDLKAFVLSRREFMLRLSENPNLLEHETFTDLLKAVFHLTEELENRGDFTKLPASDTDHLILDSKRAYGLLVVEWMAYMRHLKNNYPYLFSLAMRLNPFDPEASAVVRG